MYCARCGKLSPWSNEFCFNCGAPVPGSQPIRISVKAERKKARLLQWGGFLFLAGISVLMAFLFVRSLRNEGILFIFFFPFSLVSGISAIFHTPKSKGKRLMASYGVDRQAEQSFEQEVINGNVVAFGPFVLTDNWMFDRGDTLALMPLREIVEVRKIYDGRRGASGMLYFGNGQQLKLFFGSFSRENFLAELQRRCPWIQINWNAVNRFK